MHLECFGNLADKFNEGKLDSLTRQFHADTREFIWKVGKIRRPVPDIAAIKDVQPYHEWQSPHLAFLHELNNWDKHRVLHLAETEFSEVGYFHPERVEQISAHTPGRLKPGAVIAHYRVLPGYDVDVGFYIATDIALQHGIKVKGAVWRLAPFIAP